MYYFFDQVLNTIAYIAELIFGFFVFDREMDHYDDGHDCWMCW